MIYIVRFERDGKPVFSHSSDPRPDQTVVATVESMLDLDERIDALMADEGYINVSTNQSPRYEQPGSRYFQRWAAMGVTEEEIVRGSRWARQAHWTWGLPVDLYAAVERAGLLDTMVAEGCSCAEDVEQFMARHNVSPICEEA